MAGDTKKTARNRLFIFFIFGVFDRFFGVFRFDFSTIMQLSLLAVYHSRREKLRTTNSKKK
jgi:hypothetical protein